MHSALAFSLSRVRLGLEVSCVREVLPCAKLVRPPEMPRLLRGFLNLDGHLIPVVRLEQLLQLALEDPHWKPETQPQSRIIVAELEGQPVAWLVDEGVELLRFEKTQTVKLPRDHTLNNCASEVIPRPPPEMSIVLLDPGKLLLESERTRLAQLRSREQERLEQATTESNA
jgi:purine-binding chemotaxis protein CheW